MTMNARYMASVYVFWHQS